MTSPGSWSTSTYPSVVDTGPRHVVVFGFGLDCAYACFWLLALVCVQLAKQFAEFALAPAFCRDTAVRLGIFQDARGVCSAR